MKAAIQVLLIATGSPLVYPNAIAQPKPLGLAYQVTWLTMPRLSYSAGATPSFFAIEFFLECPKV